MAATTLKKPRPQKLRTSAKGLDFIVSTLPSLPDPSVAIAATKWGATGLLNLEYCHDWQAARCGLGRLAQQSNGRWGIKVGSRSAETIDWLLREIDEKPALIVVVADGKDSTQAMRDRFRGRSKSLFLEVTCTDEAHLAQEGGFDGIVAKGHEAGGRVGEETTFILLQRILSETKLPVWAFGGLGLHTLPACFTAGAAGVVLDNQLLLTRESWIPQEMRSAVERMEGDETLCLGQEMGDLHRVFYRPGFKAVTEFQKLEKDLVISNAPPVAQSLWRDRLAVGVGWNDKERQLWFLGQDAAFAKTLGRRFRTVRGVLQGLQDALLDHLAAAKKLTPLDEGSPLALSHGTKYPIVQGPMTRVSDTAGFAASVAKEGGLPFLALALLRGPQVKTLLEETQQLLENRPWGVGILGFVPAELREEQLAIVEQFKPKFALIAGGRPDQAAHLEKNGTATYLHVPSPGLLEMFLESGARRFVFEGRECGGHVGPRTSFVLWQTMVEILEESIKKGTVCPEELHILFAGGIHDARSAAMVATITAPLAEQRVRIGVLMGTGYLFTEEAVSSGTLTSGFQQKAVKCDNTVLLETGPGHATRCAETPFFKTFKETKRDLAQKNESPDKIREELETLNLGRLRLASKGIKRNPRHPEDAAAPRYIGASSAEQQTEGMYMIGQLAALRRETCRIVDLHREIALGSSSLLKKLSLPRVRVAATKATRKPSHDIAIVGMGCLLPQAKNADIFWQNVLNRKDAITEVPHDRWDSDLYFDGDRSARDKVYSKWGGFLEAIEFNPMHYGIPPKALPSIDPFQLLSLEVVRQALSHAGYAEREFSRETTSVILGAGGGLGDLGMHYGFRAGLPMYMDDYPAEVLERLPEWTEDSFAGILLNVAAGRVANRFNLRGVNFTIDAACASSLAAVYLAKRELELGTSDMVIVGGVDTTMNPFAFLCFSKAHALSPSGRCRTFDETADGIAIGEGLTALVLKRVEDAERDGDQIFAVLKGVAGSSDGRAKSLTAPLAEGQSLALQRAYAQAEISPATVGLIEAHGTGTVAGDTAEIEALSGVFSKAGARPHSCGVGSVKSMIGHTKCSAGVTGLMKAALALHHKTLPPTLHVEKPIEKIREEQNPFFVNTAASRWLSSNGDPRRAGVSSFGFGGTNFHAILQEYDGDLATNGYHQWPQELFFWEKESRDALASSLRQLLESLRRGAQPDLPDLAASVCCPAQPSETGQTPTVRLAMVVSSLEDLQQKIQMVLEQLHGEDKEVFSTEKGIFLAGVQSDPGKLAFLFPGQGSQRPQMLRDLSLYFPEVGEALERANQVLKGKFSQPLSRYVYPPPAFDWAEKQQQQEELTDTVRAQPALGTMEVGLSNLLVRLGLRPQMAAGHSYGEYVALWLAGVFSERTLLEISEARGRFIKQSVGKNPGAMVAVSASKDVEKMLGDYPGVWIANFNSPGQTILSGRSKDLEAAVKGLADFGYATRKIPVSCGFHSPLMKAAQTRLARFLASLPFSEPKIPVYSNSLASAFPAQPAEIATILSRHLVEPLRFVDEIEAMHQDGARIFLEVGPGNVLGRLTTQILKGKDALVVSIDEGKGGIPSLLQALAQLAVSGVPVDLKRLFEDRPVKWLDVSRLDTSQPAPAPGTWLVDGGKARPQVLEADRPLQLKIVPPAAPAVTAPPKPEVVTEKRTTESLSQTNQTHGGLVVSEKFQDPDSRKSPNHTNLESGVATDGSHDVIFRFQQLMSQFLQTQTAVMTAYLGSGPGTQQLGSSDDARTALWVQPPSPPAAPRPAFTGVPLNGPVPDPSFPPKTSAPAPLVAEPEAAPPFHEATPAPVSAAAATPVQQPAAPEEFNCVQQLLEIVKDRTGYPAEMLDPDLNIEADLGIDSIKRVEILSAFQRLWPEENHQQRIQESMEQLTSMKTLRELGTLLTEVVGINGKRVGSSAG